MPDTLEPIAFQAEWWWTATFRPRLEGLTDDELHWEPAPGCWGNHAVSNEPGIIEHDFDWPPPQPAPLTTIAWRLCHIGIGCLAGRASRLYPDAVATAGLAPVTSPVWDGPQPFPNDAGGVLAFLDRWWAVWIGGLRGAGEDDLWRPLGTVDFPAPVMRLGEDDHRLNLVFHVHRELLHHGGEVGVLRDLFRALSTNRDP